MGEKRNVYRLLVGKPEGKRPLGRERRRWIDNIKIDLLEILLSVVDWIGLAQDRYRCRALVNAVMNFRVPYNAWRVPRGCIYCGLSIGTQLHRVSQSVSFLIECSTVSPPAMAAVSSANLVMLLFSVVSTKVDLRLSPIQNAVFRDVMPFDSCKDRRFGGT
jgi:hypothetical protein